MPPVLAFLTFLANLPASKTLPPTLAATLAPVTPCPTAGIAAAEFKASSPKNLLVSPPVTAAWTALPPDIAALATSATLPTTGSVPTPTKTSWAKSNQLLDFSFTAFYFDSL